MRKITTFALLFTFVIAGVTPTLAQRSVTSKSDRRVVSANQFDSVRAITEDGSGVVVRWQMKSEKNVGVYNVYRIGEGSKELVSTRVVPGSAGRFGDELVYGEHYYFFDAEAIPGTQYVVEGTVIGGDRFYSDPVSVQNVKSIEGETGIKVDTFRETRTSTNSDVQRADVSVTGELQDIVSLHAQEPNPEQQRMVASQPGVKIAVRRDGFYRVTRAELQAANFPVNTDSAKWRLFMNGNEQAITVAPDGSYFDFYGRGIDDPETNTRYYYLMSDIVAGKRIGTKVLRQIPGSATAQRYQIDAGKKERFFYLNRFFNYEEENFFGTYINPTPSVVTFNLSQVDRTANARIKVTLVGFGEYQNHRISVTLNGHSLPDITQYGRVYMWNEVTIPGEHLEEGQNRLEFVSSGIQDEALFDRVEVSYQRQYVADQGKISFTTPGSKKVDISGFTSPAVRIYDLSFDGNPVQIVNVPVVEGATGYTVKLPSSRPMVGYAVENDGLLQSPGITENLPSTLSANANTAEMLIISHSSPSIKNEAQAWATYRETEAGGRLPSRIADIADIYDEFSFGESKSIAIKDFLKHTYENWATRPKYVLLIGDGTYDPKNFENFGSFNMIPAAPVRFIQEEGYSDDALADFDDDGFAEFPVGRIPARTGVQVATALNKIRLYEQNQLNFNRGSTFAYDNAFDFDFEGMSHILADELPPGAPRNFIIAGTPTSNSDLIASLNEGKTFVNYSGHGAAGLWSSSNFFTLGDVPQLTNANNPTLFSMLTCLNGYFLRTNAESLSEALIFKVGGGAAASWASTSETTPDVQLLMAQRFVRKMSEPPPGNLERIGDLIKDAKTVIGQGADVRLSWVLIGDPAMKTP